MWKFEGSAIKTGARTCFFQQLEPRLLLDGVADLDPGNPADAAILGLAATFQDVPVYTAPEAAAAREDLRDIIETDTPSLVYGAFAEFARWHFGAGSEPKVYELYGSELGVVDTSTWQHVSENSASFAWETNLSAYTFVQYGLSSDYGQTTEMTDRAYYQHLHQIGDLDIDATYHYRFVAIDERGEIYVTPDATFTTSAIPGAIHIAGGNISSPIVLSSGGYYVLTGDIVSSAGGITTKADNITLDLNGHTILYGQDATSSDEMYGIWGFGTSASQRRYMATNLKIFNGKIVQGTNSLIGANTSHDRWNPMRLGGHNHEIAGVSVSYWAPQSWGILNHYPSGDTSFHHNVFTDSGALITNRHGAGSRVIGFQYTVDVPNNFAIYNNLVRRARQNGIGTARTMYNNEIYIDSWSTNSFAIQPLSVEGIPSGDHHHNKIFATGFNAYGFGWAHEDLNIHDNYVMMHGFDLSHRWDETWGDINLLEAFRVTNYAPGGQIRNNLTYWNNTAILRGSENAEIRGTGFYSDETISNLVFRDNYVKAESLDAVTQRVACIDTQGYFRKEDSLPVFYNDNVLVSNICNVRFGDSYGKGNNHMFNRCDFVRIGDRDDYHTFAFDGTYWSFGHIITDGKFYGGAAPDDVYWRATGSLSSYSVAWTLTVNTDPSASIVIRDKDGNIAFSGPADTSGSTPVALKEYIVRPVEWLPSHSPTGLVGVKPPNLYSHQKIYYAPYTVEVTTGGVTQTYTTDAAQPQLRTVLVREGGGEVSRAQLPPADQLAILEGRSFWADIYVRSNEVLSSWVFGGSFDLSFDPAYGQVLTVEPVGEHWQQGTSGVIDNVGGTVTGISRDTGAPVGGEDEWVLLARVQFTGEATIDPLGSLGDPQSLNLAVTPSNVDASFVSATPSVANDGGLVYPVIYDFDDSGVVLGGDLSYFSEAFGQAVGPAQPPYTAWADFDGDRIVSETDRAWLAGAYRQSVGDIDFGQLPSRYRPSTWTSGDWARIPFTTPLAVSDMLGDEEDDSPLEWNAFGQSSQEPVLPRDLRSATLAAVFDGADSGREWSPLVTARTIRRTIASRLRSLDRLR
jgi:hypothetical protein